MDLSGRPFCRAELGIASASLGDLAGENAEHFLTSLAASARITLHVDVLEGTNAHHKAEAAFKALALALRDACSISEPASGASGGTSSSASTKGRVSLEALSREGAEARASALRGRKSGGPGGARELGGRA